MALRFEKAFRVETETLMRMQNSFDIARTRGREKLIQVKPFEPNLGQEWCSGFFPSSMAPHLVPSQSMAPAVEQRFHQPTVTRLFSTNRTATVDTLGTTR